MQNVQLCKCRDLHFSVIDSPGIVNQLVKTFALRIYQMNWIFFVYENCSWKYCKLVKFKHVNVSNICEVTFHLVSSNSFEIHHSTNHSFFFLLECAVKKLTEFSSPWLFTGRVPRFNEWILQFEVINVDNKLLFHGGSYSFNFANLKLLTWMYPVNYSTYHGWLLSIRRKQLLALYTRLIIVKNQCAANRVLALSVVEAIIFYQYVVWVPLRLRVRKSIIINYNWVLAETIISIN